VSAIASHAQELIYGTGDTGVGTDGLKTELRGIWEEDLAWGKELIWRENSWSPSSIIYDLSGTKKRLTDLIGRIRAAEKHLETDMPEPALLPILGLILLPTLLRRR
jgi:hypothetical protein